MTCLSICISSLQVSDKEARSQKKSSCGYYLAANSQSKIVISNLARHVTRLKLMELMKDIGPVKVFNYLIKKLLECST